MQRTTESNALAVREEASGELQQAASEAAVMHEIQGAIIVAKRFPRDEDAAYQAMVKAAARYTFAEEAQYSFPRGDSMVKGPSIYLAREFARAWGNIRHGAHIIHDEHDNRMIRGWAWDVQTNTKVEYDDNFKKIIYRKNKGWLVPDERDLRELTNRRAAIAKRNCILELLPSDLVAEICREADKTLEAGVQKDPDAARKGVLKAFATINVTSLDLQGYLGCEVSKASPAQIAELRKVYKSIRDGQAVWADYLPKAESAGPPVGRVNLRQPRPAPEPAPAPAAEPPQRQPGEDDWQGDRDVRNEHGE